MIRLSEGTTVEVISTRDCTKKNIIFGGKEGEFDALAL